MGSLFADRTAEFRAHCAVEEPTAPVHISEPPELVPLRVLLESIYRTATNLEKLSGMDLTHEEATRAELGALARLNMYKEQIDRIQLDVTEKLGLRSKHFVLHVHMAVSHLSLSLGLIHAAIAQLRAVRSRPALPRDAPRVRDVIHTRDEEARGAWADVRGLESTQTQLGERIRNTQEIRSIERATWEIQSLNEAFALEVEAQAEIIDTIYALAVESRDNIDTGNESLQKAVKRIASSTRVTVVFLIIATLLVLIPALVR